MQTFLPYASFTKSAMVLDRQRLGKQRVEALQILNTLVGVSSGWRHHPAVKMWVGHEGALAMYAQTMCTFWIARGYNDTVSNKITSLVHQHKLQDTSLPSWWGDDALHRSHRSNLLRKMPEHYSQFFTDPHDLPYVWLTSTR